jgi:hypothetical protein
VLGAQLVILCPEKHQLWATNSNPEMANPHSGTLAVLGSRTQVAVRDP